MIKPSSFAVFALKFLQKSMMFSPCGPSAVPTGGAGVALPAAIWSFTCACTFFAIFFALPQTTFCIKQRLRGQGYRATPVPFSVSQSSELLHLQKIQLDRRGAAEDRDHHLQRIPVRVHVVDDAVEAGERAFVDSDLIALLE